MNEGVGRIALVVTLDCGEQLFMDTCKLFRRPPRGACYTARLLKKPTSVPEGLEVKGHDVRMEACTSAPAYILEGRQAPRVFDGRGTHLLCARYVATIGIFAS